MTAEQISTMIRNVTKKRISPADIRSTAVAMLCKGRRADASRTLYYDSAEIDKILRYYEFEPSAFIGRG